MLDWIRRLMGDGKPQPPATRQPAPAPVSASVPAKREEAETGAEEQHDGFLCREPILGRDQKIVAYEFSHPQNLQSRFKEKRLRVRQFYDDVLLQHLAALDLRAFLQDRLAFIELSPASLTHPDFARLPRRNLALTLAFTEIAAPRSDPALSAARPLLERLRAEGMLVGLKWQAGWRTEALPEGLDFVQVSRRDLQDAAGEATITALRPAGAERPALRLVAADLCTPEDFRLAYRQGFDLFRGDFIRLRAPGKVAHASLDRLRILQLLQHLRHDAETARITQEIRQDPMLSYRLLRYVNSPAFGMRQEIKGLDQALALLGRDNFYRWLSTLLFHVTDPGYYEYALIEQALARAALLERLGKAAGERGAALEALFLTGLFSLLDKLMGEPLEKLTAAVQLPTAVTAALVRREGKLAKGLALAEACETLAAENIAECARVLGFSAREVNLALVEALAWAHEMAQASV
ncbi:MAG: HDOD domain-containing protein [Zoogloeaceae bacterium]|jgi:EAL and modified HD-GYP domain-containing signal transduction protein|nr:HDOD domain-containing protein [Zoogloeaceae bacterium]